MPPVGQAAGAEIAVANAGRGRAPGIAQRACRLLIGKHARIDRKSVAAAAARVQREIIGDAAGAISSDHRAPGAPNLRAAGVRVKFVIEKFRSVAQRALAGVSGTAGAHLHAEPDRIVFLSRTGDGESCGRVGGGAGKHVHTAVRSRGAGHRAALRQCRRRDDSCNDDADDAKKLPWSHRAEPMEAVVSTGPVSLCAETETAPLAERPAAEVVQLALDLPST
jgi:hypothetical protein